MNVDVLAPWSDLDAELRLAPEHLEHQIGKKEGRGKCAVCKPKFFRQEIGVWIDKIFEAGNLPIKRIELLIDEIRVSL